MLYVEKVVKPPRMPVTKKSLTMGDRSLLSEKKTKRMPMQKDPMRLARMVPYGKNTPPWRLASSVSK